MKPPTPPRQVRRARFWSRRMEPRPRINTVTKVWVLAVVAIAAWAQGRSGLRGHITDPSGRAIPDAAVTLLKGTATVQTTRSDVTGHYQFRNVEARAYPVRAAGTGVSP